ncbi:TetR/AcrR family transcriptional regulator [Jiangella rhizosphaerae]|uniref:TetR/AcrR family transcriptional regulator n=1 Tax=Jiangella rhizosphaerae TaxID=2293569 RepID=A0A418KVF4_9ACTN|nr:TetR/AcrR family transcriptional regulator [Jiangella rhizosphaerae]RIQ32506.1 TetR/AcrR family transcriptional regulator [Jiangella rhizosphaerae]
MGRGRPRGFDRDEALDRAMRLFWTRGYQDTSIADLTEHLGIGSPSLYAAFGSKASLFCAAADRYQAADGGRPGAALAEAPTARAGVEALLRENVALFTKRGGPRGCLLTRATLSCPPSDTTVVAYLERSRRDRLAALRARLRTAEAAGEPLPSDDIDTLAQYYDAQVQGLAVRALEGATRPALLRTVDLTMAAWDALSAR